MILTSITQPIGRDSTPPLRVGGRSNVCDHDAWFFLVRGGRYLVFAKPYGRAWGHGMEGLATPDERARLYGETRLWRASWARGSYVRRIEAANHLKPALL